MVKKICLGMLIVSLLTLFVVTVYFYRQHSTITWKYEINKVVMLGEFEIYLDELSVESFNDRPTEISYDFKAHVERLQRLSILPRPAFQVVYALRHLYSRPYEFKSLFGKPTGMLVLTGKIPSYLIEKDDSLYKRIDIDVGDGNGVHYCSGWGFKNEGGEYVEFWVRDRDFFLDKRNDLVSIIIEDKATSKKMTLDIDPIYEQVKSNYFDEMRKNLPVYAETWGMLRKTPR